MDYQKSVILSVDDTAANIDILIETPDDKYDVIVATGGLSVLACVSMAIEMRDRMNELYEKGIQSPFRMGAGINAESCTVGNFGSNARMDNTIIGSHLNVVSRRESSEGPNQINISHETYSLIKDSVYSLKSKPIMVKGIAHSIQSFQKTGNCCDFRGGKPSGEYSRPPAYKSP